MRRRALLLAAAAATLASPAAADPCCGPVTAAGRRLTALIDGMGVETRWQRGWHVDWQTGAADRPWPGGPEAATHCSAFAAAVAARLGIYLLRPPEHPQELLANAQLRWLAGPAGAAAGWQAVADAASAQALANRGALVLAAFAAPDPHRPGHIAVLRPSLKDSAILAQRGPQIAQAGEVNSSDTDMATGFAHHHGAWIPGGGGAARFWARAVAG